MTIVYRIVLVYSCSSTRHLDGTWNMDVFTLLKPRACKHCLLYSPSSSSRRSCSFHFWPCHLWPHRGMPLGCKQTAPEKSEILSALSYFGSYLVSGDLMTSNTGRECSVAGQRLPSRVYKSAHPASVLLCSDSPINQSTLYIGISFTSNSYPDNSPTTPIATHNFWQHRQTPSDVDESSSGRALRADHLPLSQQCWSPGRHKLPGCLQ
jgi:hypothetical protein